MDITKVPEPMFYVRILHEDHSTITREGTGEWDGDDIDHEHFFYGFEVSKENKFWDFILNEDPTGKEYYLVYVLYSTGDSFHTENNCLCMLEFLDSYEDARTLVIAIETDDRNYTKDTDGYPHKSLEIKLPKSGRTISVNTGTWKGYFEHFSSVRMEKMTLP